MAYAEIYSGVIKYKTNSTSSEMKEVLVYGVIKPGIEDMISDLLRIKTFKHLPTLYKEEDIIKEGVEYVMNRLDSSVEIDKLKEIIKRLKTPTTLEDMVQKCLMSFSMLYLLDLVKNQKPNL